MNSPILLFLFPAPEALENFSNKNLANVAYFRRRPRRRLTECSGGLQWSTKVYADRTLAPVQFTLGELESSRECSQAQVITQYRLCH